MAERLNPNNSDLPPNLFGRPSICKPRTERYTFPLHLPGLGTHGPSSSRFWGSNVRRCGDEGEGGMTTQGRSHPDLSKEAIRMVVLQHSLCVEQQTMEQRGGDGRRYIFNDCVCVLYLQQKREWWCVKGESKGAPFKTTFF